jgi:predicted metalloprotease with PDZ domain
MSLKMFFIELGTNQHDLLELMCHNYVHSWVNKEVTTKPVNSSKYQLEDKMGHLKAQREKLNADLRELEILDN